MVPRFIFAGTPPFAANILSQLLSAGHPIEAVLCQPDRPQGRHKTPQPCAVKEVALAHQLPCYQPERLRTLNPDTYLPNTYDLMIVAAYGLILPTAWLHFPRLGCLNVHASLLPRWRGAAPVQYALLSGDEYTGISLMQMTEGMDEGPIVYQTQYSLSQSIHAPSVLEDLSLQAVQALNTVLPTYENWLTQAKPQPNTDITYAPKLNKTLGQLQGSWTAETTLRHIAALDPWPGTYGFLDGAPFFLLAAELVAQPNTYTSGTLYSPDGKNLYLACSDRPILLKQVKRSGQKACTGAAFLCGHARHLPIQIL